MACYEDFDSDYNEYILEDCVAVSAAVQTDKGAEELYEKPTEIAIGIHSDPLLTDYERQLLFHRIQETWHTYGIKFKNKTKL